MAIAGHPAILGLTDGLIDADRVPLDADQTGAFGGIPYVAGHRVVEQHQPVIGAEHQIGGLADLLQRVEYGRIVIRLQTIP